MDTIEFNKACWKLERERFRKVIAAAVEGALDWQPEPKSRSSRRLIGHMIGHVQDMIELADDGVIHHRNEVPFGTLEEALSLFDQAYDAMQSKLEALDTSAWSKPADFRVGDMVIMTAPIEQLAWMMLFDTIHHRGQLTTYLRPTGGRVPALYGPSADEQLMTH